MAEKCVSKKLQYNVYDFRDRFTNHSDIRNDTEIFSPISIHPNETTDKIDWLDQYTNAHRIAEENIEFMRIWLLKLPFLDLLNELKMNYIGKICSFTTDADRHRIEEFVNRAIQKQDTMYLIQAYTANTAFFYQLNKDLARRGKHF
jgi:hypothetical protein